eukprot:TRINITY_DN472_c1_g1_i3.p1 TRINITY_DN472_c1_g1~~TRINITY_DN472_c1_g1_i3.p1  ORF type:complete len:719 (-),score=111.90 TRINITY_DN472_c1_g1_i3:266-2131(-)
MHMDADCSGLNVEVQKSSTLGKSRRRRRPTTWSEGMRACQWCGCEHLDIECSEGAAQKPALTAATQTAVGMRRSRRRRRPASWSEGMRACQWCGGEHLDVECTGEVMQQPISAVAAPTGPAGPRSRRRRRPATWSEGMRACQWCGGGHLDVECTGEVMQQPIAAVAAPTGPRGRRSRRRRRPMAWSDGMRACQWCGGEHLDIECTDEVMQKPTAAAAAPAGARARRRRPTTWSEGMRPCKQCGGDHLDVECSKQLVSPEAVVSTKDIKHFVGSTGFMGLTPNQFARSFDLAELDFTFHDQGDATYEDVAAQYAKLGLHVVVKVSRYATHIMGLQKPREWWPWLKSKYRAFMDAGILAGLLWQLPPSFVKTEENLNSLGRLGAELRNLRQGMRWQQVHHAFEFRNSSWFDDMEVAETMGRHKLTTVTSHAMNETGWAGDLASGWHGPAQPGISLPSDADKDFAHVRCLGTEGRSVGSYSAAELLEIAQVVQNYKAAVIIFGQSDAPPQAVANASKMRSIMDGTAEVAAEEEREEIHKVVTGTVVASVTRGWNPHAVVDVDGQKGYLGYRHLPPKKGLELKVGTVLQDLQVEADSGQLLFLSAPELVHQYQHKFSGPGYRLTE